MSNIKVAAPTNADLSSPVLIRSKSYDTILICETININKDEDKCDYYNTIKLENDKLTHIGSGKLTYFSDMYELMPVGSSITITQSYKK